MIAATLDLDTLAINCRDISVRYGEVHALSEVSIAFPAKGIHVVVGQNGAGKTSLARVLAGLVKPHAGTLAVNGAPVGTGSVAGARSAGIELVHQSFALPPSFTVAEALAFGAGSGLGLFRRKDLYRRCEEQLDALDIAIPPDSRIFELPIEQQQAVEIARALSSHADILILDEPTAVLPPTGINKLFERIRHLKDSGVTVLLILHKAREVWAIADTITVLRSGRLVAGPMRREDTSPVQISKLIMGVAPDEDEQASDSNPFAAAADQTGTEEPAVSELASESAPALEIIEVSTEVATGEASLDNISFAVKPGEIIGVAGVEGNGQVTLVRVLAGLAPVSEGMIGLNGRSVVNLGLAERRNLGLRIIPFDRNSEGLSLTSELWENWAAGALATGPMLKLINPAGLRRQCKANLAEWGVVFNSTDQHAASLSGGNSQKLILARELDRDARVVIAAQPTRGLDIGATGFVWSTLQQAKTRGCGVLLISSDLDELFELSDRLLVMSSGRVVGTLTPPYSLEAAGRAMTGTGA